MLRAIRELGGPPVVTAEAAHQSPAATKSELETREGAERRQVTVLFSDLVGSTALAARMSLRFSKRQPLGNKCGL